MFGKEYANHLDTLTQSFSEMNKSYQKKVKVKKNFLIEKSKQLYLLIFGIPEIGFQIRSLYFQKILTANVLDKDPKKIMDAGSGIGAYTFWLGEMFPNATVLGGEIDKTKLRTSNKIQKELQRSNVSFLTIDLTKPQKKSVYDLIVIIDVLEHIENYEKVLKHLTGLLRPSGYLYIHVPQSNQKRIFSSMKSWEHEDHVHEGITKKIMEKTLRQLQCKVIVSEETFGFFGKLAWELNHMMLSKSFILTGLTFPFLYVLAIVDSMKHNKNGLGVALLVQKK